MASVTFKRTDNIDGVTVVDGQLIFDTSDQKIYLDNGNTREVYGGGSGTDLISDVSDATDNNAFNANATVNLFTRKSSIVDTKAEIQSVTQAGVPLGCKGFNEVVGTGDISALGDGSITGAILANKSAIDTVNQNLTNLMAPWRLVDTLTITTSSTQYDLSEDLHGKHILLVVTSSADPTLIVGSLEIHGELGYIAGYVHLNLAVVSFGLIDNTLKAYAYTQNGDFNKLKIYVKD